MPIRDKKEVNKKFYSQVLEMGRDSIPQGEVCYPVCGLCANRMFEEALTLVDKGYKCTHKGYEADEIYNIIKNSIRSMAECSDDGKNMKEMAQLLCEGLGKEVAQYEQERVTVVAYDIRKMLEKDTLMYRKEYVKSLRKYLPNVYSVLAGEIMGSVDVILKCCDMQFAKDCIKNADKERWSNEVRKMSERQILMCTRKSFNEEMNSDCQSYADIVAMIQEETGVFSDAFMSDFAILRGIVELRYLNVYGDKIYDDCPRDICYEDDMNRVLDNVKAMLERYMPAEYTFGNLLYSLVEIYPDDYEEWVGSDIDCFADTDLLVLDAMHVIAQKKKCELIISDRQIAGIMDEWKFNNNVKWMDCYDADKLKAFQSWLDWNCTVIVG
ncbi:MAG: hypothetical protein IJB96_09240 [Lachnospira sp.]|nr:hypothetical protein [Lachnospira sp.]